MNGLMGVNFKVNGSITKCMDLENSPGPMEESMQVNM
jgi:hypothetical protein